MPKPVLIGQAPGPNTDPLQPLYPAPRTSAGGRLAQFMGLDPEEYLASFDRFNLINRFPGKSGDEDKFPLYEARIAAAAMKPLLRERAVILLGRNVATVWDPVVASIPFFSWVRCPVFGTRLSVVPHPSGRNHWYNDEGNRELANCFWQTLVASLNGGGQRGLLPQSEVML